MIICPNPSCKTANPESADTCQVCQSVLPHYYLWGVGDLVASLKPGTLLNQRYLLKRDRVFLDTKPGILPESLPEIPDFLMPYLHLSAYPLHVPRPYSVLRTPDKDYVMMLESSALSIADAADVPPQLPRLINCWASAPPLRQLNWLWQIAQIWDAFVAENVAATLLDSSLLRVDGSIVRLLELASPMPAAGSASTEVMAQPTLVDLARSWQPLAESADQAVRAFLGRLCESLERQQINAEQLTEQLSLAISVCGSGQQVAYDLSVNTDQGPTRKRNEDACFPETGTELRLSSEQTKKQPQLLIVCDGIGGHQGGDVASKLAISTIKRQLDPLLATDTGQMTATELSLAIEGAICAANDEISAQNDQAQRQARDRMGTTLVLALLKGSEVYIAHLGDSRAYRVSDRNCQQVTLDDDVASRQVRLGGSLYREVLVQPGAGSLIQALGMGPSQSLRPTVQRFVIDESCVFLLCSDGLSDSDRVEQFWQRKLKPLVGGEGAADTSLQLVDLANRYNGHDNVTVGLLNAQVVSVSDRMVPRDVVSGAGADTQGGKAAGELRGVAKPTTTLQSAVPASKASGTKQGTKRGTKRATTAAVATLPGKAAGKTKLQKSKQVQTANSRAKKGGGLKKAAIVLVLLALAGGVLYSLLPRLQQFPAGGERDGSGQTAGPDADSSSADRLTQVPALALLEPGDYVRIRAVEASGLSTVTPDGESAQPDLTARFYATLELGVEGDPRELTSVVLTGGIVQVLQKQAAPDESSWVKVKLCMLPFGDELSDQPAETGAPVGEADAGAKTERAKAETDPADNLPFNQPETADPSQPLLLEPGQDGWILAEDLAAIAQTIPDAQPSQKGRCEG